MKIFRLALYVFIAMVLLIFAFWQISRSRSFQFLGELHHSVSTQERVMALTFDDGPNPFNTPAILELLHQYQAKATFFMIGTELEKHPDLGRQVVAAGHQLGNHSYSHRRMLLRSPAWTREELDRTDALIRGLGYEGEIMFRSPYGKKFLILPYVLWRTQRRNILWNVESRDTETQDPTELEAATLSAITPGSIVIFHDGGAPKPGTLATLEKLLRSYQAEGWRFVRVDELLQTRSHD
jgi:peptidoglycan/xylan/chitin deacetylase (PgdA/CDA1 family)